MPKTPVDTPAILSHLVTEEAPLPATHCESQSLPAALRMCVLANDARDIL